MLIKCLFVLKTFQDPAGIAFKKLPVFVSVHGEGQSALDKIIGRIFSHIYKVINVVVNPRFVLTQFGF